MAESILDGLKARRRAAHEQIKNRSLDLELPSYSGELVVRYRPPEWEDAQPRVERFLTLEREERIDAACDLMIACCDMVLIRVDGELRPLHEVVTEGGGDVSDYDRPVRFDERLARAVGVEIPAIPAEPGQPGPARLVVLKVVDDKYGIAGQGAALANWLTGLLGTADQDF